MKKVGLLFFAILLIPGILFAGETPRLYSGIRPLGMGNAFITLSDDSNALFFNPAGLNDIEKFNIDILSLELELGENALNAYSDVVDLSDELANINNSDADNAQATLDFVEGIIGENQHIRASTFPNISFRNFSIGVIGTGSLDLMARSRTNPKIITNVTVDYGPVGGFAFSLYEKALQVGVSAKFIQRMGLVKEFSIDDIATSNFDPLENLDEKKSDIAFDIGLKYNLKHSDLKPSFALVFQNLTDLDFTDPDPNKDLGMIPQTINIGAGIKPKIWILDTVFVAQLDDITEESETDLYKRLHLGMELNFPMILALRAGINQGWITYGATINLWVLKLDAASYSEEIGEFAGQKQDKRFVAQLSLGLEF